MFPGFINDFAEVKGNIFQVWPQALILLRRKRSEKPVPHRVGGVYQSRHK
jgi:hypothetical protein